MCKYDPSIEGDWPDAEVRLNEVSVAYAYQHNTYLERAHNWVHDFDSAGNPLYGTRGPGRKDD